MACQCAGSEASTDITASPGLTSLNAYTSGWACNRWCWVSWLVGAGHTAVLEANHTPLLVCELLKGPSTDIQVWHVPTAPAYISGRVFGSALPNMMDILHPCNLQLCMQGTAIWLSMHSCMQATPLQVSISPALVAEGVVWVYARAGVNYTSDDRLAGIIACGCAVQRLQVKGTQ